MKIWKEYNQQKKRDYWHARFRLNNKPFTPKAETKDELLDLIAEIRTQEKAEQEKKKYNLDRVVIYFIPTVKDLLNEVLPTIKKNHQRTLGKRVFETFVSLLPPLVKVNELKTFHFQLYINHRQAQIGKITKRFVTLQTIFKELYCLSGSLKNGIKSYEGLINWEVPKLPETPKGFKKKQKRERIVLDSELFAVINKLLEKPTGKQTFAHHFHRVRLAHTLEFANLTGFRRKEIARLKFSQYNESKECLNDVVRWKTETVTKFYPLGKREIEIINERQKLQNNSEFIFTPNGEPIAANYRTIKEVSKKLKIPYGKFADNGFIIHDLRHNFGSEIVQHTDIKTAMEFLGHSRIEQTADYLHTNQDRMRLAVKKREKVNYDLELKEMFEAVKNGKIEMVDFISKVKGLFNV